MDTELISRLNELWRPIYPYLAQWISRRCATEPRWILELGPFSGGISSALRNQFEDARTICLMRQIEVAQVVKRQFEPDMEILVGHLERLPFVPSFDISISRGAFFFLTTEMIKEAHRILNPGGWALLGGGYGPFTPPEEISEIAGESKRLNYQLGKTWISKGELKEMVREARMERYSEILEEGGLWLLLRKA